MSHFNSLDKSPLTTCPYSTTALYRTTTLESPSRTTFRTAYRSSTSQFSTSTTPPQPPLLPPKPRVHAPLPTFSQDLYIPVPLSLVADILFYDKRKSSNDSDPVPLMKRRRVTVDCPDMVADNTATVTDNPSFDGNRNLDCKKISPCVRRRHSTAHRRSAVISNSTSNTPSTPAGITRRRSSEEILFEALTNRFQLSSIPGDLAPLRRPSVSHMHAWRLLYYSVQFDFILSLLNLFQKNHFIVIVVLTEY